MYLSKESDSLVLKVLLYLKIKHSILLTFYTYKQKHLLKQKVIIQLESSTVSS